jgi:hypothetical protein
MAKKTTLYVISKYDKYLLHTLFWMVMILTLFVFMKTNTALEPIFWISGTTIFYVILFVSFVGFAYNVLNLIGEIILSFYLWFKTLGSERVVSEVKQDEA